jgi:hypothetical protein
MKTRLFLFLIAAGFLSGNVAAQIKGPLPEEQWNAETELWLARAMVSEADWSSADHAAIAWTLKRQWEARRERFPDITFVEQIRAYCAGLRGAPRSSRMKWVLSLEGDLEPEAWPKHVAWPAYAPHWNRVRAFARAWFRGEVRDPCKKPALHWGGPGDMPPPDVVPVDCGLTSNIFYTHGTRGLIR